MALARMRADFVQVNALDAAIRAALPAPPVAPTRLAVLGSATLSHLLAAIRLGGMRRGLWIDTIETGFGQYRQFLHEPVSGAEPDAVLLSLDAHHLTAGPDVTAVIDDIRALWHRIRDRLGCPILQQAVLPVHLPILGENEHRLASSRARMVVRLNAALRDAADRDGVDILAVDDHAARDGIARWHDRGLWHRAKQEIALGAAPLYGELVARWLAARLGKSAKCLVLDLDNTLWGGVVGDDGLDGIRLGPGSAEGEAFAAFQAYALALSRRGVILAVCSKNEEATALAPFTDHPDMVLRRSDIAAFVANWSDKPANLRAIAATLAIGLDAMVFLDDSRFERDLVRRELPMVGVPEPGDDPACYAAALAEGGYFEAVAVTAEDRDRTAQYQANHARAALRGAATDLDAYLRGLSMTLTWRRFDPVGLPRIVQLVNKTNQFNLTGQRIGEPEARGVMTDPDAFGLQFRLADRFGDNGMIAVVIGRRQGDGDIAIGTWLMSCRVLGRQVEQAMLGVVAGQAAAMGGRRLIGAYVPTPRNAMVRDHYAGLGFTALGADPAGGSRWALDLAGHGPAPTFIDVREDV